MTNRSTQWMPLWMLSVIRMFRELPHVRWNRRSLRRACPPALFAHLFDGADELVAQLDTMSRDWTTPTSTWHEVETLGDLISRDTFGLPTGAYWIALGLYDAVTQERPLLRLPDGSPAPNAALQKEIWLP